MNKVYDLLCTNEIMHNVLDTLDIKYKKNKNVKLQGSKYIVDDNHNFYFEKSNDDAYNEFTVIEIEELEILELDKFQAPVVFKKVEIRLDADGFAGTALVYEKCENDNVEFLMQDIDTIKLYKDYCFKPDVCDVCLFIPGKFEKNTNQWQTLNNTKLELFDFFNHQIKEDAEAENSSEFMKDTERKCVSPIVITINEVNSNKKIRQSAVMEIVKHQTGFCIIEIFVLNCNIGGNKLLNYYCGNQLLITYQNQDYTIEQLLKKFEIRKFGKKRSMVFSNNLVKNIEIVNALANEEYPMADIKGDFEKIVSDKDIAQYSTAEVYLSEDTLFEKCNEFSVFNQERIAYMALEMFFVELILFYDAAIDKIHKKLQTERKKQAESREKGKNKEVENINVNIIDELSFEMDKAMKFTDYEHFLFPTVRMSARKISKGFGIDRIFEKYEENKRILESMISANEREIEERQEKFLLLLSIFATVQVFTDVITDALPNMNSGLLSLLCFVVTAFGAKLLKFF